MYMTTCMKKWAGMKTMDMQEKNIMQLVITTLSLTLNKAK